MDNHNNSDSIAAEQEVLKLANRVLNGELRLSQAKSDLHKRVDSGSFTLEQSQALASQVTRTANPATWKNALVMAELSLELSGAMPRNDGVEAPSHPLMLSYLRAVTVALTHTPDFTLYQKARDVAATLLRVARRAPSETLASWVHTELGQLHLHPLQAQQTHTHVVQDAGIHLWYEQGVAKLEGGKRYPYPGHAFLLASKEFRRSRISLKGRELGLAVKAEINALEKLQRLSGKPDLGAIIGVIAQVQALLDPVLDAVDITYLMGMQHEAGHDIDHTLMHKLIQIPIEHYINSIGPANTTTAHLNMAELVARYHRGEALSIMVKAEPAIEQVDNSTLRVRYFKARLGAMARLYIDKEPDLSGGVVTALKAANTQAQAEDWPMEKLVNVMFAVILATSEQNLEQDGMRFLHEYKKYFAPYYEHHTQCMDFLKMVLSAGAGVNDIRNDHFDTGLEYYAVAVKLALRLEFKEFASIHMGYIAQLSSRISADSIQNLIVILFDLGLDLEISLGEEGAESLQTTASSLTELMFSSADRIVNDNMLHLIWQLAKSRRFGAALRSSAALRMDKRIFQHPLLGSIAQLRKRVSLFEEASAPGSQLDRSRRLLTYVRSEPPAAGASAVEQLVNLQHRFDHTLEHALAVVSNVPEADLYALNQISEELDERTVLLQLFLCEFEGKRAVATMITHRSGSFVNVTPDNVDSRIRYDEHEREESGYSYLEDVVQTRRCILDTTLGRDEQYARLHMAGGAFLHGGVGQELDRLAEQGADHLVCVPHGPFHLAPLHLLARDQKLLCDDWIVTVLPNIELMRRAVARPDSARVTGVESGIVQQPEETKQGAGGRAAVFALDFISCNPFALSPLKNAPDEAARIARKLDVKAVVNAEATEAAFKSTIENAHYIHVASHGAFNLDAPAFQYVVLAPDGDSNGLLHAYELLEFDLKGVSMVTLSACETALTRMDRLDNPRGIAAALLLAGVQTIVGTLWTVKGDASRAFFVELYAEITKGKSRRDAFRTAQKEVRRRFPEFRDWGAFYLAGAWS